MDSLLGLTELLFVPAYWNPPSLFDLARRIHLDVESLLFSFGVGGLTAVIYESLFPIRHATASASERHIRRHRFHILALLTAPLLFVALVGATRLNPIYSAILSLMGGGVAACYCRPDLMPKMAGSAFLFLGFYFAYFFTLVVIYPDYVRLVWNLPALSRERTLLGAMILVRNVLICSLSKGGIIRVRRSISSRTIRNSRSSIAICN